MAIVSPLLRPCTSSFTWWQVTCWSGGVIFLFLCKRICLMLNIKSDPLHTAENNWFWFETSCPKYTCLCAQSLRSCPTLCDTLDCSPPGSSVHGILQSRILEWVAMPWSRVSSQPRDWTCISCISCIAGGFFTAAPKYTWGNSWQTGFPGGCNGKEFTWQCRRHNTCEFNPWVWQMPQRRKWHPTPVFLLEEFHGQKSLANYSLWGCKELDMTEHTHTYKLIITPCLSGMILMPYIHCLNLS